MLYVPPKARKAFRKEFAAAAVCGVMVGGLFPFLPFVASHRLGASATLISLMLAAPWVGSFASAAFAHATARKPLMRTVSNVWILARATFILMLFVNTPYTFALITIVAMFLASLALPGYACIMKAIYPDDHRGKIMAYIRVVMWLVATLATFIAGPILRNYAHSYQIVFPIAAVFGVVSVYMFRTIDVPGDDEKSLSSIERVSFADSMRSSWTILTQSNRRYGWFILTTTIYGFGNFLMMPVYPKYMDEYLHMDEYTFAIYSVITSITMMIGFLYWGHYIDGRSPLRAVILTILINALLPLTFAIAPSYIWILPGAVLSGIMGSGLELAYMNAVLDFAPDGEEMRYQGIQNSVQGLRGIVGPITGGLMYDLFRNANFEIRYVFLVSFVQIMIGWCLLVYGMRWKYPKAKAAC